MDIPDVLVDNLIPASQIHCLLAARNENLVRIAPWVSSWYYGPLESEGHSVVRGMMAAGYLDFARRALEYYIERYNEDGFLTTGYTVMGTGWHLWTLGEYYRLAHDPEWMRAQAPKVEKVCRWIMSERRKTMRTDARGNKVPEYGLMPPGVAPTGSLCLLLLSERLLLRRSSRGRRGHGRCRMARRPGSAGRRPGV